MVGAKVSSQGTDIEEKEANLFAAELLMPARFIEHDIEEIGAFDVLDEDSLDEFAQKYGVSTQAMSISTCVPGIPASMTLGGGGDYWKLACLSLKIISTPTITCI